MPSSDGTEANRDFAREFGDALSQFLRAAGMGPTAAAKLFELIDKRGKPNRALVDSYCHDTRMGTRPKPNAEILYLACTKLKGFYFDYKGYRISAETLNGHRDGKKLNQQSQLEFDFQRQFILTGNTGSVRIKVKKPPGKFELSVHLDAKSS